MLKAMRNFFRDDDGSAAIEAGFLFPLMLMILTGVVDAGIGTIVNMKVTNSAQIISDLLGREVEVNDVILTDAIVAGRLALMPYETDSYGVDIAGIRFEGHALTPTVEWRETQNMEPNLDVVDRSEGLGLQGEGVIVVSIRYEYHPYFGAFMDDVVVMQEEAYVRGRRGTFIPRA